MERERERVRGRRGDKLKEREGRGTGEGNVMKREERCGEQKNGKTWEGGGEGEEIGIAVGGGAPPPPRGWGV